MKNSITQMLAVVLLSALLIAMQSCKPEKTTTFKTTINFKSTFGSEILVLNKLVSTSAGDSIKFTMSKILLSEIDLLKSDGSSVRLKDAVFFGEAQGFQSVLSDNATNFVSGDFIGVRFNFGLTTAQNNTDPTSVSCPNPLCADNGMWWGSVLKYTHIKIEGQVKPNGTSQFGSLIYHVGTDTYSKTITINQPIVLSKDKDNSILIALDIKKILDGANPMNMITESRTQTTDNPTVAAKFADNIQTAFSLQ